MHIGITINFNASSGKKSVITQRQLKESVKISIRPSILATLINRHVKMKYAKKISHPRNVLDLYKLSLAGTLIAHLWLYLSTVAVGVDFHISQIPQLFICAVVSVTHIAYNSYVFWFPHGRS